MRCRQRRACNFNPRTPVGCDRPVSTFTARRRDFNPRTPVGCDEETMARAVLIAQFQSTHPSGVRLGHLSGFGARQVISIHAPQWGATHQLPRLRRTRLISIHAPQWGATPCLDGRGLPRRYFNPRTPVGCDLRPFSDTSSMSKFQSTHPSGVRLGKRHLTTLGLVISIHAPQWGATGSGNGIPAYRRNFNPRTPVGCD